MQSRGGLPATAANATAQSSNALGRLPCRPLGARARPSHQQHRLSARATTNTTSGASSSPIVPEAIATTRAPADLLRQLQQQQQQRLATTNNPVATIAAAPSAPTTTPPLDPATLGAAGAGAAAAVALALAIKRVYDTPSRAYDRNVGDEYDAWTEEGILEHYWGEHIHLGYYTDDELQKGWWRADFKAAKLRFTQEMFRWSGCPAPLPKGAKVLDVGCGFGGSSRWLAATNPDAQVTGITLSPRQVERGTQLARERGLENVDLRVMDALDMQFEDGTFDLVWACESGEHMPDKAAYVREMARVLKPGGTLVLACWCQRDADEKRGAPPLTETDKENLRFLCEEWAHPYFISIEDFGQLATETGLMEEVELADWTRPTLASWRHSNLVGVLDPWYVVLKWNPKLWYKVTREIVTLERMHRAFDRGLMVYGMMRATKKVGVESSAGASAPAAAAASSSR
jgi:MPBQ/MSBQ methyltransferase